MLIQKINEEKLFDKEKENTINQNNKNKDIKQESEYKIFFSKKYFLFYGITPTLTIKNLITCLCKSNEPFSSFSFTKPAFLM